MAYRLDFRHRVSYGVSKSGILLPVVLGYGDRTVSVEANVDTGASVCVFERHHAAQLGLDPDAGLETRIATVTGSFVAYGYGVVLRTLDIEFGTFVYFAADDVFCRLVLGRRGWLDLLIVGIAEYDREI